MDWRNRRYFVVSFSGTSHNARIHRLKALGAKLTPYKPIYLGCGEMPSRGYYQYMIGVSVDMSIKVQQELIEANLADPFCRWHEITHNYG